MDGVFDVRGGFGSTSVCRSVPAAGVVTATGIRASRHAASLALVAHEYQS
jgi:hypothetical protein